MPTTGDGHDRLHHQHIRLTMADFYALRATLSDGFTVDLDGLYPTQTHANRAAVRYMTDYRDPCGLGVHVAQMAIVAVVNG